jgi:hypothetical protein
VVQDAQCFHVLLSAVNMNRMSHFALLHGTGPLPGVHPAQLYGGRNRGFKASRLERLSLRAAESVPSFFVGPALQAE